MTLTTFKLLCNLLMAISRWLSLPAVRIRVKALFSTIYTWIKTMGLWKNICGTFLDTFYIGGKGGPGLMRDGNVLECVKADGDPALLTCKTASAASEIHAALNKQAAQNHIRSHYIKILAGTGPTFNVYPKLIQGYYCYKVYVNVMTAFAPGSTLRIGRPTSPSYYLAAGQIPITQQGRHTFQRPIGNVDRLTEADPYLQVQLLGSTGDGEMMVSVIWHPTFNSQI